MTANAGETLEFKTELKQLLHLITHSLYSNKKIVLRELVSNASDAIHKLRFNSLDSGDLLGDDKDFRIVIDPDPVAGTLTIRDNGIGMSRQAVIENLGTVARSGTKAFLEKVREAGEAKTRPDLIGQFGVGFYSSYMIADTVEVITRQAGDPVDAATRWTSDGQGEFTVVATEKVGRGTDVILHLKDSEKKEFTNTYELREIVRQFSDFLETPIYLVEMRTPEEEEEDEPAEGEEAKAEETEEEKPEKAPPVPVRTEVQVNTQKALWLRPKSEVTPEEYQGFYQQIGQDMNKPARVIHYAAEGRHEYRVLLFVPSERPYWFDMSEREHGPRLYIQRVLIMEHCKELLPRYLRFVTGLVDCSDLPLNISREILQHNDTLEAIRKDLIREIFKALRDLRESELPAYETFFKGFGTTLKEGVREDHENREKVADLLLYPSLNTPVGEHTTLERYIAAMPEGQKDIYYLTGDSDAMLRASPKLEAYRAKGRDVLFMIDAVDEYILPSLSTFKGKSLRSADSEKAAEEVASPPPEPGEFAPLLDHLKKELTEVSDVRLSSRLIDSPACLVTPSGGMSGHLERLLDRMGQGDRPKTKRILELNAGHAAVLGIKKIFEANAEDVRVAANARLLVDQAMLADGSPVEDLAGMAKRLGDLIARDAR